MNNKKGFQMTWEVIVVAAILIITMIVILVWATGGFGKLFGGINEKIEGTKDCDKDGSADLFDKCPCDSSVQNEWPEDRKDTKKCNPECTSELRKTLCPEK